MTRRRGGDAGDVGRRGPFPWTRLAALTMVMAAAVGCGPDLTKPAHGPLTPLTSALRIAANINLHAGDVPGYVPDADPTSTPIEVGGFSARADRCAGVRGDAL